MPPTDPNRDLRRHQGRADAFFIGALCGGVCILTLLVLSSMLSRALG